MEGVAFEELCPLQRVLLVLFKKHALHHSVLYPDAVEEAICFGGINGKVKTIDTGKFMQRYSPRKSKGRLSETDIERAKRMTDQCLMTEDSLYIFKTT